MSGPLSDSANSLSGGPADALVREMADRWRAGERPCAEEFLDRRPELWRQPEAALALVYEEICLRREHGEPDAAARVAARFPQWHAALRLLSDCDRLFAHGGAGPALPEPG